MTTPNRRNHMPITEALYPRKKRRDDSTPEERLAEHKQSMVVEPVTFRITGTAKATLAKLQTKQQQRRPRRRSRKPVTAQA